MQLETTIIPIRDRCNNSVEGKKTIRASLYARCALAGAFCRASTRAVLTPVDVYGSHLP